VSDKTFHVGDRGFGTGGYDAAPRWLAGGTGYSGVLKTIEGDRAVVELDQELTLTSDDGWQDFGNGSSSAGGHPQTVNGHWLVLSQAYVGGMWTNPTARLQVGLCSEPPNLTAMRQAGGIGAWVESHAHMTTEGKK